MKKLHAFAVVFISGISVTALEIAAARIVAPFFGNTVYVWGGSIGTVLTSLAVGYWLGGKIVDRFPTIKLLGIVLLCAGITALMIPLLYAPFYLSLQQWTISSHVPIALAVILAMLLLFLVPLVCLGMVSPVVLRLSLKDLKSAGSWSGLLSGGSTLGSILGTFMSAFWLIPVFGSRITIIGAGFLLVLLAMPYVKNLFILLAIVIAGASTAVAQTTPIVDRSGLLTSKESPYQLVQVAENNGKRLLYHDTAIGAQSIYVPGESFSGTLYDSFGILPFMGDMQSKKRSVLVIGLAGASSVRPFVRALQPQFDFDITGVEIDPDVITAAKKYFDLNDLGIHVVNDDARYYLTSTQQKFDIIIVDAYTNELVIPPMLATQEFFTQLRSHLQPGGVIGMNAAALPLSRYYPKLINTIASVFPDVRQTRFYEESFNNIILAGEEVFPERANVLLPQEIAIYRDQIIPNLQRAKVGGDIYTDDRTDLDIRVRPFIN